MMRRPLMHLGLLILASSLTISHLDTCNAAPQGRFVRQASEGEQEATTAKSTNSQQSTPAQQQNNGRLYPDIPQQPQFVPQFNGLGPQHYQAVTHHHGQAPLVPFGIMMPTGRLNADQEPAPFGRVLPQPRPMTPAERLQSQSFANGLGRRLLSMIGIETGESNNQTTTSNAGGTPATEQRSRPSQALQNSTVLQQLHKGLNSIYGGLSKMYNSTVQEQLNLLQERLKAETQNSTNPWHQRMAEQVPQFFKQMASKVGQAQDQLNRVWQDVSQAAQGNTSVLARANQQPQQRSFFNSIDQFFNGGPQQMQGGFFNNIGRSLGMDGQQQPQMMAEQSVQQGQQPDLGVQLREFWHSQVQPQIGMVRNQMARVWRDLTSSGSLTPETIVRSRSSQVQTANNNSTLNLVDDILKEVDMGGSEYTLIDSKDDAEQSENKAQGSATGNNDQSGLKLSPQMQNRLVAMQRELNQLWMGLTNSLQGAINNVKQAVNPPSQLSPIGAMVSTNNQQHADPEINEIDGKVRDLSKLQRDADMVYDTVQQQQREAQRQSVGDRFKSFLSNMNVDLSGVNQLPDRIGQSFNRFGTVVGDFWNQIPERWDNFMHNARPQQRMLQQQQQNELMAKMKSTTSTTTTTESPRPER